MTRADVTVGVAAAVAAVFAVGAFLLVVAAGRADRRERAMLRAARAVSAEAAARSVTDQPAAGAHRERPRVPAQYSAPDPEVLPAAALHAAPLDPARTDQLLAEISDALAAAGAAAPVEGVAPRPVPPPGGVRCVPGVPCPDHHPIDCRRYRTCCGTCPSLPA